MIQSKNTNHEMALYNCYGYVKSPGGQTPGDHSDTFDERGRIRLEKMLWIIK